MNRIAIIDEDTENLLGYISQEPSGWAAMTIFGYVIARTVDRRDSESLILTTMQSILKGAWRYYDNDENDWFACKLKEVYENRVVIVRTNELGFEDRSLYKLLVIKNPSESNLQMA